MRTSASTLNTVRRAVRSVLDETPQLQRDPALARRVAQRMVEVSLAAADLIAEEKKLTEDVAQRVEQQPSLAQSMAAGDFHRQTAVNSAAGVLRGTREAIDFPNFVTSLITGVFQSIQNSSIQQLQAFADLLEAVSSSASDFASSQITNGRAAQWAISRWSGVFALEMDGEEPRLVLRGEADMPEAAELARVLEATEEEVETIDEDELGETLLPLVRRKLARDRQSMLSTMVLMGLQRVVVDDGSLHASMRLQVDARSVAEQRQAEQFDTRIDTEASGSFGMGAWGASAKMSASVGYVRSDDQYSREDIAVQAGLRSSVDLRFRTLPLDVRRMASDRTLEGIRERSMVPSTERELGDGSLLAHDPTAVTTAPTMPTPAAAGDLIQHDRGTMREARDAREHAAAERRRREDRAAGRDGEAPQGGDGEMEETPSSAEAESEEGSASATGGEPEAGAESEGGEPTGEGEAGGEGNADRETTSEPHAESHAYRGQWGTWRPRPIESRTTMEWNR